MCLSVVCASVLLDLFVPTCRDMYGWLCILHVGAFERSMLKLLENLVHHYRIGDSPRFLVTSFVVGVMKVQAILWYCRN